MSFKRLEQWQRHRVKNGACVRCQQTLPGEGAVCTRMGRILLADHPKAKDCGNVEVG